MDCIVSVKKVSCSVFQFTFKGKILDHAINLTPDNLVNLTVALVTKIGDIQKMSSREFDNFVKLYLPNKYCLQH